MAETMAEMSVNLNPVHVKKGRSKRALKPKDQTANEANILAGKISQSSPSPLPSVGDDNGKENSEHLSQRRTRKQTKKTKESKLSFENELQEIQGKLEQLRLEKEKTEELLKVRDEMLKQKDEELENRGRQQEKLQLELKKLQKLKEFKPTVNFPLVQSLREKEQEKNVKSKKKAGLDIKKPSPAYVLWCKEQWNEVKKENPDAEFKEISNMLGSKWKNLIPEEKKPYEEKYQADKEAYLQIIGKEKRETEAMKLLEEEQKQKTAMELLDQYIQFKQEIEKESKKTSRKERDPLKPKQPLSAFFLFSKERRATRLQENINILEIAKLAGEEWKNMTETQRGPYEEMAKKHKEDYLKEMEKYKQKKDEDSVGLQKEEEELMKIHKQEALQLLKKKEKADNIIKKTKENRLKKKKQKEEQNLDPRRPKKPASSFLLYSKEMRKELLQERPGISNPTLNALISVKWKELNEADKQLWNVKAAEAMEAYKKEMEEYNKSSANNPEP